MSIPPPGGSGGSSRARPACCRCSPAVTPRTTRAPTPGPRQRRPPGRSSGATGTGCSRRWTRRRSRRGTPGSAPREFPRPGRGRDGNRAVTGGAVRHAAPKTTASERRPARCFKAHVRVLTDHQTAPPAAEADLRRALDTLSTFVGLTTPDGVILDVNEAPLRLLGVAREEVIGRNISDLALWNENAHAVAAVSAAMSMAAAGETPRLDVTMTVADGRRIVLDLQVVPLRDDSGRVTHLVPSAVDVTERRATERDLREREERFRATFDV